MKCTNRFDWNSFITLANLGKAEEAANQLIFSHHKGAVIQIYQNLTENNKVTQCVSLFSYGNGNLTKPIASSFLIFPFIFVNDATSFGNCSSVNIGEHSKFNFDM